MKRLVLMLTALIVGTLSYANSSSLTKNSPSLDALVAAWKIKQTAGKPVSQPNSHMIYGGADLSPKTTLISPTATA